jgi:HEAT repeat protein
MKRRAQALALAVVALPLGLLALEKGGERAPRGPDVRAAAPELAPPAEPLVLAPAPLVERRERVEAPLALAPSDVAPSRAPRAVRELAALLTSETFDSAPFDRAGLERATAALARELGPDDAEALAAGLAGAAVPLAERLAACELLRVLGPRPGTLPDGLRAELHSLLRAPGTAATPESAAHALLALGSSTDARLVIEALADEDATVRARCRRALAGASSLPEAERLALADELELALSAAPDPRAAPALRRALAVLRPPAVEPESLERALLAPGTSPERRLLAAVELARDPGAGGPEALDAARERLVTSAETGSPRERRRALLALGTLADPGTLPVLTRAACSDADPAARSAAVRALRPFEARATLETVAARDPSPEVRALAAQELTLAPELHGFRGPAQP